MGIFFVLLCLSTFSSAVFLLNIEKCRVFHDTKHNRCQISNVLWYFKQKLFQQAPFDCLLRSYEKKLAKKPVLLMNAIFCNSRFTSYSIQSSFRLNCQYANFFVSASRFHFFSLLLDLAKLAKRIICINSLSITKEKSETASGKIKSCRSCSIFRQYSSPEQPIIIFKVDSTAA